MNGADFSLEMPEVTELLLRFQSTERDLPALQLESNEKVTVRRVGPRLVIEINRVKHGG